MLILSLAHGLWGLQGSQGKRGKLYPVSFMLCGMLLLHSVLSHTQVFTEKRERALLVKMGLDPWECGVQSHHISAAFST